MLTKTQFRIMQFFTSSATSSFSSMHVSKKLAINYKNAHTSIKSLSKIKFLKEDHNLYSLNYKTDHQELAYAEHLRTKEFLKKKKNSILKLFIDDVLEKFKEDSFILIIFGSTVNTSKPRDTDILVIVDSQEKVDPSEKALYRIGSLTTLKLDINVISDESVYEMLGKRDENNLINMLLNKHLIIYGAEKFYRMLAKGRL